MLRMLPLGRMNMWLLSVFSMECMPAIAFWWKNWKHCRGAGRKNLVFTFSEHPRKVLHSDFQPALITTLEEKLFQLSTTGVDACVVLDFTEKCRCCRLYQFLHTFFFVNIAFVRCWWGTIIALGITEPKDLPITKIRTGNGARSCSGTALQYCRIFTSVPPKSDSLLQGMCWKQTNY